MVAKIAWVLLLAIGQPAWASLLPEPAADAFPDHRIELARAAGDLAAGLAGESGLAAAIRGMGQPSAGVFG